MELTKISDTTFSKEEVKVQIYSLPQLKARITMIDNQIANLNKAKVELEKLCSEASKIGVVEKVEPKEVRTI